MFFSHFTSRGSRSPSPAPAFPSLRLRGVLAVLHWLFGDAAVETIRDIVRLILLRCFEI
jgi:hypothetical protein